MHRTKQSEVIVKKNQYRGFFLKKANKYFDENIYSKRSLVESVFSSLKRKFGERLMSRKYKTKSLEMSLKILIYNVNRMSNFFLIFVKFSSIILVLELKTLKIN